MFKKYGDEQPIDYFVDPDADEPILCPKCDQPMTMIELQDGNTQLICYCEED